MTGSRLGSAELYASTWRSVTIAGSKINYLNARTADWQDVRFTDSRWTSLISATRQ